MLVSSDELSPSWFKPYTLHPLRSQIKINNVLVHLGGTTGRLERHSTLKTMLWLLFQHFSWKELVWLLMIPTVQ